MCVTDISNEVYEVRSKGMAKWDRWTEWHESRPGLSLGALLSDTGRLRSDVWELREATGRRVQWRCVTPR